MNKSQNTISPSKHQTREPVYLRLTRELKELVGNELFPPGSRFLTEREISKQYSVSRLTANKVLAGLAAEGLLEFRIGSGTYVRGNSINYELNNLVSFTHRAMEAGRQPSTKVVRFEIVAASTLNVATQTALEAFDPSESFYWIERIRYSDLSPVILETRYVRAGLCPGLRASELSGSIYELWAASYRLSIAGVRQKLRAVALDAHDAVLLTCEPGDPAVWVEAVGHLINGQPLWCERLIYRADAYEFVNTLGRIPNVKNTDTMQVEEIG